MTAGSGSVAVPGGRIAWECSGSGPLAVWAHGLTQSGRSQEAAGMFDWSPVTASGRSLLRYDARGHGESAGTPGAEAYTWPALAGDLLTLLDGVSPQAPVAGIGTSMGTATLLHAAVRAPGRFDRLVLTAPPTAWAARDAQREAYEATAQAVDRDGMAAFQRLLTGGPIPPAFTGARGYPPAPRVAADLLPSVLRGAARSDLPPEEDIASLPLPVLVLAWDGDPVHPVATAERLAELLPAARLSIATTSGATREWGHAAAKFLAA
ncbi:alpha/beta fold hydrolase [Streptomyces sp. NPDC001811]